jgi:hypothetical protein
MQDSLYMLPNVLSLPKKVADEFATLLAQKNGSLHQESVTKWNKYGAIEARLDWLKN